jgi:hypothetical protein
MAKKEYEYIRAVVNWESPKVGNLRFEYKLNGHRRSNIVTHDEQLDDTYTDDDIKKLARDTLSANKDEEVDVIHD